MDIDIIRKKAKRYLINKVPIRNFQQTEKITPFFIIGSGRNGSTLLSAILNNHKDIFIPPEQYALANTILKWHYQVYTDWDTKLKSIIDFFLSRSYNWKSTPEKTFTYLKKQLAKNDCFENIFYELYKFESLQKNKSHLFFGDKTPYNTFYVPLLIKVFPQAKFIFLNRDPRDVAASMKKMNNQLSIHETIYRWKDGQKQLAYLHQKNKHVYEITYEEFVQQPKTIIDKVIVFLNAPPQDDLLSNYSLHLDTLGVGGANQHSNIKNNINTKSIGKYKTELSSQEIELIESTLKGAYSFL